MWDWGKGEKKPKRTAVPILGKTRFLMYEEMCLDARGTCSEADINETQALGSAFPFLEAQEGPWLLWQTQCPGGT